MTGTDIATRAPADLSNEELLAESERLAGKVKAGISPDEIALPLIKLSQALSAEVQAGNAVAGEYINSVTGKNYSDGFDLIVVERFKGWFFAEKESSRAYAARGDVVPDNWPEQYAGQRFSDLDDAEPTYKERVNAGEIEWGKGPPISTTHNFVGFVRGELDVPVRVSLMRTNAPAATTINTLIKLQDAAWDNVVRLETAENTNSRGQKSFKVVAREGEATTEEEKLAAIRLALELERVTGVVLLGDDPDADGEGKGAKPKAAAGALDIE